VLQECPGAILDAECTLGACGGARECVAFLARQQDSQDMTCQLASRVVPTWGSNGKVHPLLCFA